MAGLFCHPRRRFSRMILSWACPMNIRFVVNPPLFSLSLMNSPKYLHRSMSPVVRTLRLPHSLGAGKAEGRVREEEMPSATAEKTSAATVRWNRNSGRIDSREEFDSDTTLTLNTNRGPKLAKWLDERMMKNWRKWRNNGKTHDGKWRTGTFRRGWLFRTKLHLVSVQ